MTEKTIDKLVTTFPISAEALKSDPASRRPLDIIQEFSVNTSTHGIPGIARSQSIQNRIFWIASTLAFTGIMLFFILQSMKAYFSYPTQTSVSINVESIQIFPAVSICNISPIRVDKFIGPYFNYTNSQNWTNTSDLSSLSFADSIFVMSFIRNTLNNGGTIKDYFFPLESMLLSCSYNDIDCSFNDFIPFLSSTYGACYTFNAKMKFNQTRIRRTIDNAGVGRLKASFYVHSHQYMSIITEDVSSGLAVMIHDNTELPMIDIAALHLGTGMRHKLNYKKKKNDLLRPPYSDCTTEIPLMMQEMFNKYGGADYAYSQVICYSLCIQVYVYAQCGCVNPYQWTIRSVVLPGTNKIIEAPLCDSDNKCYGKAADEIIKTDSIWNKYCSQCSPTCSTSAYSVTISGAPAPSDPYIPYIKAMVEKTNITLPTNWSETWKSDIPKNYLSVDIVCETILVENYTQEESISPVDLLSSVGGHTGLWIGMSFLSIMELFEMVYRIIRYHLYTIRRRI